MLRNIRYHLFFRKLNEDPREKDKIEVVFYLTEFQFQILQAS